MFNRGANGEWIFAQRQHPVQFDYPQSRNTTEPWWRYGNLVLKRMREELLEQPDPDFEEIE